MAPERGAVQDHGASHGDQQKDPDRKRHAQHGGVVHRAVQVGQRAVQGQRAAVGQIGQEGAENAQRAERDDERFDIALGDEQAMHQAKHGAQHDGHADTQHHNGQRRQHDTADTHGQLVHEINHAAGNQRRHRTDRQIDAAGNDDKRHADGDDADEGRARQHVHHIVDGGEFAVEQGAGDAQGDQAQQRPHTFDGAQ